MRKRYWMRGMFIGLLLGLIIFVGIPNICPNSFYDIHGADLAQRDSALCHMITPPVYVIILILDYTLSLVLQPIGYISLSVDRLIEFLYVAMPVVLFMLIGLCIGIIYGKIKNRKSNQGQTFQS